MFDKGKRDQRHQQEDATFNKMLLCLAGAAAAELFVLLVKKAYVDMLFGNPVQRALQYVFQAFSILGIVLAAAGVVLAVMNQRKGKPVQMPGILAGASAGLWVLSVLAYYLFDIGMEIMMVLPAAAAVLIVIFFLYQREFFFNALLSAGGLVALWIHRRYYAEHSKVIIVFFAAGFVLLAAALAVSFLLRRGGGRLGGIRIMPSDASYRITWITCAVTALALALALVLGTTAGYYLLFVLVGWVFIQAVFFTVKLM